MRPKIENAPGLIWRREGENWRAVWRARKDLIRAGFTPKNVTMWLGTGEPDAVDVSMIQDKCARLQSEMLIFSRAKDLVVKKVAVFDGTLKTLIDCYQTDKDSPYHKKRFAVRKNHDITLRRMAAKHGHEKIANIKARTVLAWHKEWSHDGEKVAIAHAFVAHLRTFVRFGSTFLEDPECQRLSAVLHNMRFEMPKSRTERLTSDQAIAIRVCAHRRSWHHMALAQALQFELMLRQKDVIGEWVPIAEPGMSATIRHGRDKWIMGLRWEEIDQNLILRHTTSKRGKDIEVNLRLAPMVLEELAILTETPIAQLTRATLPTTGPVILCEVTGWPYTTAEFRRKWRIVANEAGIPKTVRNMDTRSGAISEATDAGADLEHIRHAATHSDIGMTQRYSRGSADKIAGVMVQRTSHRNKPKTSE